MAHHLEPEVRVSATIAMGELEKGADKDTIDALIQLKFDADPRVVAACVKAIAQIVSGKQRANGTLASFVGITPAKTGSKRVLSATRRLQVVVTRMMHVHVCMRSRSMRYKHMHAQMHGSMYANTYTS